MAHTHTCTQTINSHLYLTDGIMFTVCGPTCMGVVEQWQVVVSATLSSYTTAQWSLIGGRWWAVRLFFESPGSCRTGIHRFWVIWLISHHQLMAEVTLRTCVASLQPRCSTEVCRLKTWAQIRRPIVAHIFNVRQCTPMYVIYKETPSKAFKIHNRNKE